MRGRVTRAWRKSRTPGGWYALNDRNEKHHVFPEDAEKQTAHLVQWQWCKRKLRDNGVRESHCVGKSVRGGGYAGAEAGILWVADGRRASALF